MYSNILPAGMSAWVYILIIILVIILAILIGKYVFSGVFSGGDDKFTSDDSKKMLKHMKDKNNGAYMNLLLSINNDLTKAMNARGPNGNTPLHIAAESGNIAAAEEIFALSPYLSVRNGSGDTPLHIAANSGQDNMFVKLIQLGMCPYVKNKAGKLPHEMASWLSMKKFKALSRETIIDMIRREVEPHMNKALPDVVKDINDLLLESDIFGDNKNEEKPIRGKVITPIIEKSNNSAGYTIVHFAFEHGCFSLAMLLRYSGAEMTHYDGSRQSIIRDYMLKSGILLQRWANYDNMWKTNILTNVEPKFLHDIVKGNNITMNRVIDFNLMCKRTPLTKEYFTYKGDTGKNLVHLMAMYGELDLCKTYATDDKNGDKFHAGFLRTDGDGKYPFYYAFMRRDVPIADVFIELSHKLKWYISMRRSFNDILRNTLDAGAEHIKKLHTFMFDSTDDDRDRCPIIKYLPLQDAPFSKIHNDLILGYLTRWDKHNYLIEYKTYYRHVGSLLDFIRTNHPNKYVKWRDIAVSGVNTSIDLLLQAIVKNKDASVYGDINFGEHIKYEIANLNRYFGAVNDIFVDNMSMVKDISKFIILQSKWVEYCKDKGAVNLRLKLLALWYYLNSKIDYTTFDNPAIHLGVDDLCKVIGEKIENVLRPKK